MNELTATLRTARRGTCTIEAHPWDFWPHGTFWKVTFRSNLGTCAYSGSAEDLDSAVTAACQAAGLVEVDA